MPLSHVGAAHTGFANNPPKDPSSAGVLSRSGVASSTGLLPGVVRLDFGDSVQSAEHLQHLLASRFRDRSGSRLLSELVGQSVETCLIE